MILELIEEDICEINHGNSIHHIHIWPFDGENPAFSIHAVVPVNLNKEKIMDLKKDYPKSVRRHEHRPSNYSNRLLG